MIHNPKPVDIELLKDTCCKVFEVNIDDLLSSSRKRHIMDARRAFFYILRTEYGYSELGISRVTGNSRDHSTIIHSNVTTADLLDADYIFAAKYKLLYENFTLRQYVKPMPPKPKTYNMKVKPIYNFYTDDMLAKSKLKMKYRIKLLSDGYKKTVIDFMEQYGNMTACQAKFSISRDLVKAIIMDMSK
jgi:hypothetical protein